MVVVQREALMLVEANNIMVRHRIDGAQKSAGGRRGSVVMMCHSLATRLELWDSQVAALSVHHQLLRYDIRGHGGTDVSLGPYTVDLLVEDARQLIERLRISQVHFVGISLGGIIGGAFAARYPDMVSSLTLCSTPYRTTEDIREMWDCRMAVAQSHGVATLADETIKRWFTPDFVSDHPEIVSGVSHMVAETNADGYVGCAHVVRELDLEDSLGLIRAPTLVIGGESDIASSPETAHALQQKIDGAQLVVVPSAAHLCNVQQPGLFNQAVSRFLRLHS
jgi:3-oxoadipate enol-lactonase